MRCPLLSAAVTCLVVTTPAAAQVLAYPEESTGGMSGSNVPLGFHKFQPGASEARLQQLIPARYLPSNGAVFFALDVATPVASGLSTVRYTSLKITLGTSDAVTGLNMKFAANLGNPQVVLIRRGFQVLYIGGVWTRLVFDTPFRYDGKGGLVIEFQKVVDERTQTGQGVFHLDLGVWTRFDLPRPVYMIGPLGSGAATTDVGWMEGWAPQRVRLVTSVPVLTIIANRNADTELPFAVGRSLTVVHRDVPGNGFLDLVSVGFGARPWPLLGGRVHLGTPAVQLSAGTIGTSGASGVTLQIPNTPPLIGTHLVFQGLRTGPGARVTNAVDCVINR